MFLWRNNENYPHIPSLHLLHCKLWTVWLVIPHTYASQTDADRMANSVDPDQTALSRAVWSGSTMFAQIRPKTKYCYGKWATSWQNQQSDCAPSEDSDQPEHPPSLIRVFAVRMKKAWVLSYSFSAQRRLWSAWADAQTDLSLRSTHSHFVDFVMSRLKSFIIGSIRSMALVNWLSINKTWNQSQKSS